MICDLRKARSPQQISGRLCYDRNRGETGMSISHEAIYTWLYALPKGELAAMEIALRTGRARRQPRGRARSKGAPGSSGWSRSRSVPKTPKAAKCLATGKVT